MVVTSYKGHKIDVEGAEGGGGGEEAADNSRGVRQGAVFLIRPTCTVSRTQHLFS